MLASPLPSGGMKLANSMLRGFLLEKLRRIAACGTAPDGRAEGPNHREDPRGTAALSALSLSSPLSGSSPFIGLHVAT